MMIYQAGSWVIGFAEAVVELLSLISLTLTALPQSGVRITEPKITALLDKRSSSTMYLTKEAVHYF